MTTDFELKTDRAYIWLIVGKPGSGKTHCLKSIMLDYARQKHFKFGVCFTQNTMTATWIFSPKKPSMMTTAIRSYKPTQKG